MNTFKDIKAIGKDAKEASKILAVLTSTEKNNALKFMAENLKKYEHKIISANEIDLKNAKDLGLSPAMLERLSLSPERIDGMIQGILDIIALPDPVGEVMGGSRRPNGMRIENVRVPLGVIGIIYESRPNVTSDAAALCLKSGNATILRGGSEAVNSNQAIAKALRDGLKKSGLPKNSIQVLEDTSRETSSEMMQMREYIDVLIPRGGKGLIAAVVKNSLIPVIETGAGNCHIFVDESADEDMAISIVENSKISRPSVCNSAETVLIHKNLRKTLLPELAKSLTSNGVKINGCALVVNALKGIDGLDISLATEDDWYAEYNNLEIAIIVVDSVDFATAHINNYGTGHSDTIVTNNQSNTEFFLSHVDSAAVYVNVSTRFTDGGMFGMGAEIGISTQKLHARGPMGLSELTTNKYIVRGEGQVRN